jgi:hypothetical protein
MLSANQLFCRFVRRVFAALWDSQRHAFGHSLEEEWAADE